MPKSRNATSENFYNKSYFEAARRPRNRSLLLVNEDFEGEADVERAAMQQQKISITRAILKLREDRETAVY